MSYLTKSQIALARRTIKAKLPDEAIVLRLTAAADGYGSQTETFAEVGRYPCRIQFNFGIPANFDSVEGTAVVNRQTFIVTLPYDADVTETDRLEINGAAYSIVSSLAPRSVQLSKRVLCKKL
jgi:head-tail adaptor